jgi:hypothetical protein
MTLHQPIDNLRHRITGHRKARASDLRPHPHNPRRHGETQRRALRGLLEEIGLARSVLGYVADADRPLGEQAPLTLIDGHLRREEVGDAEIEVEVLDVTDAEARALLLSLDPLTELADKDAALLDELRSVVERDSAAVAALWAAIDASAGQVRQALDHAAHGAEPCGATALPVTYCIVIECRDEAEQRALLERFQAEGLRCRARIA